MLVILCAVPPPTALLWEADLYELHHPNYLTPRLLFGFCQWKALAGDLRAGRERERLEHLFLYFISAYSNCLALMAIALVRQSFFQIVAVSGLW